MGEVPSHCQDVFFSCFLIDLDCLCFSLRLAHEQLDIYKRKVDTIEDYERQVGLLREEVTYLSEEKTMLQQR